MEDIMLQTKPSSARGGLVFTLSSGKGERKKSPESCKSCPIPEFVGREDHWRCASPKND